MKLIGKRLLRRFLLFALLLAAPVLAVRISQTQAPAPGGFYMADPSPIAQRICGRLLENGFVACAEPTAVPEQVRLGSLSCGIVFPEDLSLRIAAGQLQQSIDVYVSPSSFAPELYQSHVAAAVFREYVPYLCASGFQNTAVTQEEVLAQYEKLFAQGYAFTFDVVSADGTAPEAGQNRSMAMGAGAIVLLGVLTVLAAETADRFLSLLPRLGLGKGLTAVLLPETAVTVLLAAVSGSCGLLLAGCPEEMLPAALYCTMIWGFGLLAYSILWSVRRIYVLLPVLVIAGAALCPIYTDLGLVLPWLEQVRVIVPAYWLWCISDAPVTGLVLAFLLLAAGTAAVVTRCRVWHKYKF